MNRFALEDKNFSVLRGQSAPASTIIAVGGGKGGVGKSFVSTGIAIFLAQLGKKTILVDLDLGAANIHTYIGEGLPTLGVNEFLQDNNLQLMDTAHSTRFPNLKLISGATDALGIANITESQKSRLMSALHKLSCDYIILDLSAGTHETTLDFFLMAKRKVIVTTPEPSSMENAYRFMKSSFHRMLKRFEFQLHLSDAINEVMGNRSHYGVRCPADLINTLIKLQPDNGNQLKKVLSQLNFEIVLNQTRSPRDIDLGLSIQSVSHKYFGTQTSFLGSLEYDNAVWQSLRKRRHLLIEYPHSKLYAQLMSISRLMLESSSLIKTAV